MQIGKLDVLHRHQLILSLSRCSLHRDQMIERGNPYLNFGDRLEARIPVQLHVVPDSDYLAEEVKTAKRSLE